MNIFQPPTLLIRRKNVIPALTFQMCSRMDVVDTLLTWFFERLGRQIGRTPGYFLIVPLLLNALCATGFQRITHEADPEYLFSPINGDSKAERQALEDLFPMNYSGNKSLNAKASFNNF